MPRTATAPAATTTSAPLAADLTEGLKLLKLATVRRLAPEVIATAKVQRWAPEEVLRTLIEAEFAARVKPGHPPEDSEPSGRVQGHRLTVPQPTFDHLAALDWIRAADNLWHLGRSRTKGGTPLVATGLVNPSDSLQASQ